MDQFTNKVDVVTGDRSGSRVPASRELTNSLIKILVKFGLLKEDLDYHLIRTAMVNYISVFGSKNGGSTKRRC
jgi:hypothetical protein